MGTASEPVAFGVAEGKHRLDYHGGRWHLRASYHLMDPSSSLHRRRKDWHRLWFLLIEKHWVRSSKDVIIYSSCINSVIPTEKLLKRYWVSGVAVMTTSRCYGGDCTPVFPSRCTKFGSIRRNLGSNRLFKLFNDPDPFGQASFMLNLHKHVAVQINQLLL